MEKIKKLKWNISIILIFWALLCLNFLSAFSNDIIFDLNSLGITEGFDVEARLDEYVSRAEFCQIIVNMMGYKDVLLIDKDGGVFKDISDSKYKDAINLLYQLNIISGSAEKIFSPDKSITYKEACKILVNALGYGVIVNEKTLDGYSVMAAGIGLAKNVDRSEEFLTFKNLLTMINNALDIEMMSCVIGGQGLETYEIIRGNTLRNALHLDGKREMIKMSGVITADVSTYLNTKIESLKKNQIEIEGKIYDYDGIAPIGYVGQNVDFYVMFEGNKSGIITNLIPNDKNIIINFTSKDIEEINEDRILLYFMDEENNKEYYEEIFIDLSTKFIYNNRHEVNYDVYRLYDMDNAFIKAIDNNEDDIADVIFIDEYIDCIVERIYEEEKRVYFKTGEFYTGVKYLDLDTNNKDIYVELWRADGEPADFSEITIDSILSVAKSNDGEAVKVFLSNLIITGILEEVGEDTVKIDGNVYNYISESNDYRVGRHVTAYVNFNNTIFYLKHSTTDSNYALVYDIRKATDISNNYQVKLLIPGKISVRYDETKNEDGGESVKTPKLFCRNSDVVVYSLANNVDISINGEIIKTNENMSQIINKPISYILNSNGEISKIDVLELVGEGTSKYYNSYEMTFGKTVGKAFGIKENITMSLCIPTNENVSDDDLKVYIELLNDVKYNVQGYVLDNDTQIVELIVMKAELRSGMPGSVTSSSDVAMVTRVSKTLSPDGGDELIRVFMLTSEGETEYTVSTLIPSPEKFLELSKGDLIAYSLDGFENLNGYELLQDADEYNDYLINPYLEKEKFCGEVKNIRYNYVSNNKNRWVNSIDVGFRNDDKIKATYEVFKRGNTPIFILAKNGSISLASFDDIQIGDIVFIVLNVGEPRAIVMKR